MKRRTPPHPSTSDVTAFQVVSNGPYKSVGDIYNIPAMTGQEKDAMKKCESKFVLLDPKPEYVIDRINNGYVL